LAALDHPVPGILPPVDRAVHPSRGMGLLEGLRIAWEGLAVNKLRSFLTMLGIIIGVAAVIVMIALGQGVAKATQESIQRLGTNRLYIRPEEHSTRGVNQGIGTGENLFLKDADVIREECRLLAAVAPEVRGNNVRLKYQNRNHAADVYGSTPDYFGVRSLTMAEGRAFTEDDVKHRARVAVVGYEVAKELFGDDKGVGKTIRIVGQPFKVVGVTARQGGTMFGNRDDQVTVPITTAMYRLFGLDRIRAINVQAVSLERMREAEEEIYAVMAKAHKLKPDEKPDIRASSTRRTWWRRRASRAPS
jgi:putative ABC transport system permease protein